MSKASQGQLDALHGLLAGALKDELEAAIVARRENKTPIPAALFDKVMKFLKDNGVDSPARNPGVSTLASILDDVDLDEASLGRAN